MLNLKRMGHEDIAMEYCCGDKKSLASFWKNEFF
jgi:hypothetical protein